MSSATPADSFLSPFRVRSYELDGLGHLNHAVFLNYLEQARFDALEASGLPPAELRERGWAVHVARVEVDYRRECRFGDRLVARTRVEEFRNTSMRLRQDLHRFPPPERPGSGGMPGAGNPRGGPGAGHPDELLAGGPARVGEAGAGEALAEGELAVEARVVAVWIGPDGRPMRIPPAAREALE